MLWWLIRQALNSQLNCLERLLCCLRISRHLPERYPETEPERSKLSYVAASRLSRAVLRPLE